VLGIAAAATLELKSARVWGKGLLARCGDCLDIGRRAFLACGPSYGGAARGGAARTRARVRLGAIGGGDYRWSPPIGGREEMARDAICAGLLTGRLDGPLQS
jgi:hypothetical protein